MNPILHLFVSLFAACSALAGDTVTEYATQTQYVCPANPGIANDVSTPYYPPSLITSAEIFNDFEANDLMVRYNYDLSNYTLPTYSTSNYTTSAASAATDTLTSCVGYNCSESIKSASEVSLARRGKEENAYETSTVNSMRDELKATVHIDSDLTRINDLLNDDGFLGALSVYADVIRGVDVNDKINANLKQFKNIWDKFWGEFKMNNNKKDEVKLWRSKDAANILMIMTPNYYSIQSTDYETSRKYLKDRFDEAGASTDKKRGIRKVIDVDDKDKLLDYIATLVDDDDKARTAYATFMMNLYHEYGKIVNCEEGDSSCRILNGWGALKDSKKGNYDEIIKTAAGALTLFESGIPFSVFYMQAAVAPEPAAVPVKPSEMMSDAKMQSYTTIHETISSTSYFASTALTTVAQCTAIYDGNYARDVEDDNEEEEEQEEVDAYFSNGTIAKRDTVLSKPQQLDKGRRLNEYCDYLRDSDDKRACNAAMTRHQVHIHVRAENTGNDLSLNDPNGLFEGLQDSQFYMWNRETGKMVSENIPVYVVNAVGNSPGVACNAMKFIAFNYANQTYFSANANPQDPPNNENAMMAFVRGMKYKRSQIYGKNACKNAAKVDSKPVNIANWGKTNGKSMECDEFPPSKANFMVDREHIVTTCVPDYDNQIDGCIWGKFLDAKKAGDNRYDLWKEVNGSGNYNKNDNEENCWLPNFAKAVDYAGKRIRYILNKNDKPGKERSGLESYYQIGENGKETVDNSAKFNEYYSTPKKNNPKLNGFMIVVNMLDRKGNLVDCSKYSYGSAWKVSGSP